MELFWLVSSLMMPSHAEPGSIDDVIQAGLFGSRDPVREDLEYENARLAVKRIRTDMEQGHYRGRARAALAFMEPQIERLREFEDPRVLDRRRGVLHGEGRYAEALMLAGLEAWDEGDHVQTAAYLGSAYDVAKYVSEAQRHELVDGYEDRFGNHAYAERVFATAVVLKKALKNKAFVPHYVPVGDPEALVKRYVENHVPPAEALDAVSRARNHARTAEEREEPGFDARPSFEELYTRFFPLIASPEASSRP